MFFEEVLKGCLTTRLLSPDMGAAWSGGAGAFFQGSGHLATPRWVPVAQRPLCMAPLYKEGSANPSASVKLSAVAFFTELGGCSLLTCSVLNSEKKAIAGMLS